MEKIKVSIPSWILERKIRVLYLVIDDWLHTDEVFQRAPDKEFYEFVAKNMNAYLHDGKMPPAEIAPAIMNLIDDQKSGRDLALRAGDYIALQNYMRKGK